MGGDNQKERETGAAGVGGRGHSRAQKDEGGNDAEGGGAKRRAWCRCNNVLVLRTGGTQKSRGTVEYLIQATNCTSEPYPSGTSSSQLYQFFTIAACVGSLQCGRRKSTAIAPKSTLFLPL